AARKLLPDRWPSEDLNKALEHLPVQRELGEDRATLLRAELARAHAALDVARTVADLPAGHFEITWTDDILSMPLPDVFETRAVARLLMLDAMLRVHDRDADGALASCRALLHTE